MMRLRARFEETVNELAAEHLPQALATVWSKSSVTAMFESIKFTAASHEEVDPKTGFNFLFEASFDGVVRVELKADAIDDLPIEALLGNLVASPLHFHPEAGVALGGGTEKARATLVEMRDAIRDTHIVSMLRFDVGGYILRRIASAERPQLLVGEHPAIGTGNEGDYTPVGEMVQP